MSKKSAIGLLYFACLLAGGLVLPVNQAKAWQTRPGVALSWQIKPSICVAARVGEPCEMHILIRIQGALLKSDCLYLNQQRLACGQSLARMQYKVSLSRDSQLRLRDAEQQTLLQQTLSIQAQKWRKRVRRPWSLF